MQCRHPCQWCTGRSHSVILLSLTKCAATAAVACCMLGCSSLPPTTLNAVWPLTCLDTAATQTCTASEFTLGGGGGVTLWYLCQTQSEVMMTKVEAPLAAMSCSPQRLQKLKSHGICSLIRRVKNMHHECATNPVLGAGGECSGRVGPVARQAEVYRQITSTDNTRSPTPNCNGPCTCRLSSWLWSGRHCHLQC